MTLTLVPAVWQLPAEELLAMVLVCEEKHRQSYAELLAVTGEIDQRGLGVSLGHKDTAALLRESLHISRREAAARVAQAAAIAPSSSVTGLSRPPALPAAGAALAEGAISLDGLRAILAVFESCPAALDADRRAADEVTLVALARESSPEAVRTAGRRLIAHWEQETRPPEELARAAVQPRRRLDIVRRPDGSSRLHGELDAEAATVLDGLLGPLAKPRDAADLRTGAERHGDALAEILDLAARSDNLSVQGGQREVMIVTTTLADLEHRTHIGSAATPGTSAPPTQRGAPAEPAVPVQPAAPGQSVALGGHRAETLLRQACDARLVPVVLGGVGQPLHLGRSTRLATTAQRAALVLRDQGCAHPGCDRAPKWTTPHHVIPWSHGGTTDLDNLVLLCARHHRIVHHSDWTIRIRQGIPEFRPPRWLDPHRRPRRNHTHTAGPRTRATTHHTQQPAGREPA